MSEKSLPDKTFRITGSFSKNRNRMDFSKEIAAHSKDRALEILYSDIGSRHAVKRDLIEIEEVEELESQES